VTGGGTDNGGTSREAAAREMGDGRRHVEAGGGSFDWWAARGERKRGGRASLGRSGTGVEKISYLRWPNREKPLNVSFFGGPMEKIVESFCIFDDPKKTTKNICILDGYTENHPK
jgi:hypothetical protein